MPEIQSQRKRGLMESPKPAVTAMSPIELKAEERAELVRELADKRHALEEIENESPKNYKDLKMQSESVEKLLFEMSSLEEGIRSLDGEIQGLELEQKAKRRRACEALATRSSERIKALEKELREEAKQLVLCFEAFDSNIPLKRIQISSRLIRIRHEITDRELSGVEMGKRESTPEETAAQGYPFTITEDRPLFTEKKRIEENFCHLHKLPYLESLGWEVVPGQDLDPEPVSPENSILVKSVPVPAVIDRAPNLNIEIKYSEVRAEVSSSDISTFLKKIEES